MRRCLACFVVSLLLIAPLLAKERSIPLVANIESEFKDREFTTKLILGSTYEYCVQGAQGAMQIVRIVDTEVSPDGAVGYVLPVFGEEGGGGCRSGRFAKSEIDYPRHPSLDQLTSVLPVGTRVRVTRIETKGDRIEFVVNPSGPVASSIRYRKIKFMLGKGFEASYDHDAIIGVISRVLYVERYERLQALKAEYPQLKGKLAMAEAAFNSSSAGARSRLEAARPVRDVLGQLVNNRKSYDSLTGALQDPEADQYTRQAANLEKTIASLEQEARKERVGEIRQELKSEEQQSAQLKSQLQAKPFNVREWDGAMDLLKRFDETVGRRQALVEEMTELGEPAPAEESAAIQNDAAEGQKIRGALQSQRRGLDLTDLDARYREMDQKRKQLFDNYARAFGTARQRGEGEKLVLHIYQMYENRRAARGLGSEQAKGQAAALQKDMERFVRQIGPVQFPGNKE
jgi:hypothetical protein